MGKASTYDSLFGSNGRTNVADDSRVDTHPIDIGQQVAIPDLASRPSLPRLAQNYPSPFSQATTMEFILPHADSAPLAVQDALGREVAEIVQAFLQEGRHRYPRVATGVRDGMYFYWLQAGNKTIPRMCIVVR